MGEIKSRFVLEGEQQYRKAMSDAASAVKVLNSEQKLAKAQFQNTGNAEKYAAQQSDILKQKIEAQKKAVEAARKALEEMRKNGVEENTKQFQQWQMRLNSAQTSLVQMETELKNVGNTMGDVSGQTTQMTNSLNSINKNVSFDTVIKGINGITGALESVASKAKEVGQAIWDDIRDAARWADDSATMAEMYEIPLEKYLQMEALVANGLDTSTEAILNSMSKVRRSVGKESKEAMDYLRDLGLVTTETIDTGFGKIQQEKRLFSDADDLFWKAGRAIMNMSDSFDKEAAATAIFGKGWRELKPLFNEYQTLEEYNAALEETETNSEDAVTKLAELNNRIGELENSWKTLKVEVLGSIAEPLSHAAEAISNILDRLTEYLKTPEGKQALEDMGKAIEGLFDDLGKIDPEKVVQNFATMFNGVVESFQWISDHWNDVVNGVKWIVRGWAALKLTGGALDMLRLINGLNGLGIGANAAANAGTAAGTSWGSAFAAEVMKAAPWLAGLYTLLNPAETAGVDQDQLFNPETGRLTGAGWADWYENPENWEGALSKVGDLFGDLVRITNDAEAINAIGKWFHGGGSEEEMIQALKDLGYTPRPTDSELLKNSPTTVNIDAAGQVGGKGPGQSTDVPRNPRTGQPLNIITTPDTTATAAPAVTTTTPAKKVTMDDLTQAVAGAITTVSRNDGGITGFIGGIVGDLMPKTMEALKPVTDAMETAEDMVDVSGALLEYMANNVQNKIDEIKSNGLIPTILGDLLPTAANAAEAIKPVTDAMNTAGDMVNVGGALLEYMFNQAATKVREGSEKVFAGLNALANGLSGGGGGSGGTSSWPYAFGGGQGAHLELGTDKFYLNRMGFHANGLFSVPWDGYPAVLHKGERVMPAREASRTFTSNLYVENMNMNGGLSADALAASIAARNRRVMAGYGS